MTADMRLRLTHPIPVLPELYWEVNNILFIREIEVKHPSQLSLVKGDQCVQAPTVKTVELLDILLVILINNSRI